MLQAKNRKFNFQKLSWKGSSREVNEWVKVEIGFIAKGFEKNIVLGNFNGDATTSRYKNSNKSRISKEFAYYYIDEVELYKQQDIDGLYDLIMASDSDMEDFADELLEYINKQKTKNLVIDLRGNYGGDFFVGLKLAHRLVLADSIDWKHGVYTLIDNETFSAAMSNAAQFQQLLNAKLVGQATGAKPSGYQDMGQFTLPNSGLVVTYSKRLYHFQRTTALAVFPDVPVPLTIDDYRKGQDRSLNWVWSDIKRRKKSVTR